MHMRAPTVFTRERRRSDPGVTVVSSRRLRTRSRKRSLPYRRRRTIIMRRRSTRSNTRAGSFMLSTFVFRQFTAAYFASRVRDFQKN